MAAPSAEQPHLFVFLTQPEWKLCYALAFADINEMTTDAYPLVQYATEGHEGDTWEEQFRRAIRFLHLACEWRFKGIWVNQEGVIREKRVVEPRNFLYVRNLRSGRLPGDPRAALQEALRLIADDGHRNLDPEPLRVCLDVVERQVAFQMAMQDPEKLRELAKRDEDALGSIGVGVIKDVVKPS